MQEKTSRFTFHRSWGFFFSLWIVFGLVSYAWTLAMGPTLSEPPGRDRDDIYYDNLAYSLERGDGYRLNFADLNWKKVYLDQADQEQRNEWLESVTVVGDTAARAPGYPVLLSYCYKYFGRAWVVPRIINMLMISLGLALVVFYVGRRFESPLVSCIASLTLLGDFGIFGFAGKIMTEPMALFMICLLFVTLLEASRSRMKFAWLATGLTFGASVLVRSNLNGWLLQLVVLSTLAMIIGPRIVGDRKAFLARFLLFLIGVFVVAGPWWARNCMVTEHFEPFGTSGKIGWVGGYCDEALLENGNWQLEAVVDRQQLSVAEHDFHGMSLAKQEHFMGLDSFQAGSEWLQANLDALPRLMLLKSMSHLGFTNDLHEAISFANIAITISACFGFLFSWRRFGGWATLFLFMSLATAMITWAHFGRYSVPIRPLIHLGSAVSGMHLLQFLQPHPIEASQTD